MSEGELKACPFCGSAACLFQDSGNYPIRSRRQPDYFVECSECSNRTSLADTKNEAIAAWNTRATPTAPIGKEPSEEEIERVSEALHEVLFGELGPNRYDAAARSAITALRSGVRG